MVTFMRSKTVSLLAGFSGALSAAFAAALALRKTCRVMETPKATWLAGTITVTVRPLDKSNAGTTRATTSLRPRRGRVRGVLDDGPGRFVDHAKAADAVLYQADTEYQGSRRRDLVYANATSIRPWQQNTRRGASVGH